MKCPNCQNDIYDDSKYCPYCGQSLQEKCPKCGYVVSSDDRFCSQCGYGLKTSEKIEGYYVPINDEKEKLNKAFDEIFEEQVYEAPKDKVRWKPIGIGLLVLALLFGISYVYLSSLSNNDTNINQPSYPGVSVNNSYTTYVGNTHLEGKAVIDGDTIYMTNNDGYLVSMDKDFNNIKVLLEEAVSYITVYKDKLYFADSQNYLSMMDKDGKNKEVLVQKAVYYVLLKDDKLYYQLDPDNESLYVMDLVTKETTKLNNCRSYNPNISEDSIYYSSTDGIYVMGLDGSDDKRIVAGEVYNVLYEDNKLYYIKDNLLMMYDLKNDSINTVMNMLVASFNKSGNTIVAYTSRGLVSYDIATKETKVLYTGNMDNFFIIGDTVLVSYNDNWQVIDSEGRVYSLFDDDSGEFI